MKNGPSGPRPTQPVYDSGPRVVVDLRVVNEATGDYRLALQIGEPPHDCGCGPTVLTEEAALRVIDALQKGLAALFEARAREPNPLD